MRGTNYLPIRLKELREDKHLTQTALSQALPVSQTTIGMWESGARMPSVDKLLMIAEYFNCSVDYLLGGKNKEVNTRTEQLPEISKEALMLLQYFECLNAIGKGRVIGWVQAQMGIAEFRNT